MKMQPAEAIKEKDFFPWILFVCTFLFFAFLTWCAPYSSDDLEFRYLGFSTAKEYWEYALGYGNGRLFGNLCSIILSNSKILSVLVKAFVVSSSVVMVPKVLGLQGKNYYLASFLLVVAMRPTLFCETLIWTSGFSNYVPPIWLALMIVLLIQHYPKAALPVRILTWVLLPVLGVAAQLFVEHSSGINGLLAFGLFLYYLRRKNKHQAALCGLWLLAATVGLAMMLMIPNVFYRAGNRVETYRTVYLDDLPSLILACARNTIHLSNYYFSTCAIPLCFGAAVTVQLTRSKRTPAANKNLLLVVGLSALYLALGMLMSADYYYGKAAVVQHILTGASVALPFAIWFCAACKLDPERRRTQIFFLVLAFIPLIPLLVVAPTSPRMILQSYVFVLLAALQCFSWTDFATNKRVQKAFLAVCLSISVLICSIFFCVHNMATRRDAHIQREIEKGSTTIELFNLPYQYTTTWDQLWSQHFAYKDVENLQFVIIDLFGWMNNYYS